jgi:hypothetical protein
VCITPDELAQNFGITINRIESWNFTKDGVIQPAIEDDGQAENGLTMLMCVPGSTICTFRTQFIPDFFGTSGVVNGFGTVLLQYATGGLTARRLNSLPSVYSGRDLQQDALNIAGTSDVSVNTTVRYLPEALPEWCQFEHEVTEWWIQQPIEDRYMYIGIVCGTLAAIASLLLCCWCCPCLSESREETEIKEEGIAVNVDLKKEQSENTVASSRKTESKSKSTPYYTENKKSNDDEESGLKMGKGKKGGASRSKLFLPDGSNDQPVEPKDIDVCFGDKIHPGTRQFMRLVQIVVKRDPDEQYGPEMFSTIMRKAKGTKFFTANEQGIYVKTSKSELRDMVGKIFKDAKRKLSEQSSSSQDLKKRSSSSDLGRSGSSKDLKRSSSRNNPNDDDSTGKQSRKNRSSTRRKSGRNSEDASKTLTSSQNTIDTYESNRSGRKSKGGSSTSKPPKRKNSRSSISSID